MAVGNAESEANGVTEYSVRDPVTPLSLRSRLPFSCSLLTNMLDLKTFTKSMYHDCFLIYDSPKKSFFQENVNPS